MLNWARALAPLVARILTLIALDLVMPGASSCQSADADEGLLQEALARRLGGKLRWGGDVEGGAPFQVRDPQDPRRVIGFEVELAALLAKSLSAQAGAAIEPEFVQYEWVSLPLGLEKKDFDCIVSGFEITPDRRRQFLFTRPYYQYALQLVVRQDERRIHQLKDCQSYAVGTLSGTAAERLLVSAGVRDIVGFDGQVEPYLDLELGRLDAVLLDLPIAIFYARDNPKLKFLDERLAPGYYGIALRHDDAVLHAALNRALGEIFASGEWARVLRRWQLFDPSQSALAAQPHRALELAGLGFDDAGNALPSTGEEQEPVEAVTVAGAGRKWTFSEYAPLLIAAAGMTLFLSTASMLLAVTL
ncbi:MAG: amino acid ABC transporter substrate-binding protein, partial [Planctomycetaceae bacterium]|nr:amino acid ABC transporter substrate-binding protein [Planctomycetaceae bacterium]